MGKTLRVLIVEDVEDDALLLVRELKKGGFEPVFEQVSNAEDVSAALDEKTWDIVISDYAMPQFTALDALEVFNEKRLDIPFIVVSGTVGEDIAVETMREGAHDYIMKDNLTRLVPAVRRELREAEMRRAGRVAEEALFESQRTLYTLMSNLPGMAYRCLHDWDWTMKFVSDGCLELTGYHPDDIIENNKISFGRLIHKEDRDYVWETIQECIEHKRPFEIVYRITTAQGDEKWVWEKGRALFSAKGEVMFLEGFISDITDRKIAEENLKRNYDTENVISTLLELSLDDVSLSAILERTIDLLLSIPWLAFESKGSIFLVEEDPEVLVMKAQRNISERLKDACARVPFGKCHCGVAAKTQELVFSDRVDANHHIRYNGLVPHGHYCVPIVSSGRTLGVINIYLKESRKPDAREEEFLWSLAHALAGIVERKRAQEALKESEKKYSAFFRTARDCAFITSKDGRWVDMSDYAPEFFGYESMEELKKVRIPDLYENPENRVGHIRQIQEQGFTKDYPVNLRKKDGTVINTLITSVTVEDKDGSIIGFQGTIRDVTEQKRAEEALKESEERFRTIFENVIDGILLADAETGKFYTCNETMARMLGYTREEIGRLGLEDLHPPEDLLAIKDTFARQARGEFTLSPDIPVKRKDGSVFFADINATPVNLAGRKYLMGVFRDITERKQAEQALRESEEKYRLLVKNLPSIVYRGYADWSIEVFDDKVEVLTGYSMDDFNSEKMKWSDVVLEEDIEAASEAFASALKTDGSYVREYRVRTRDGKILWIQDRGQIILNQEGEIEYASGVFYDITEQRLAKSALAAEKERLAVTLRSIADGVISADREGKVTLMNRLAEELLGTALEDARGRPLPEVFCIVDQKSRDRCEDPVEMVLRSDFLMEAPEDAILLAKDGAERLISYSCAPKHDQDSKIIGAVLVFRDVTERRRLEEEASKADKLESLGILAGGIGHDFNNMLTAMLGNIMLAKEMIPTDQGKVALGALARAEDAGFKASNLAKQLLTFAKGGAPVKDTASIVSIIGDTSKFVLSGSKCRCYLEPGEDIWAVDIDTGQMSQVFSNLLINASQAMPEGGNIYVEIENTEVEDHHGLPVGEGRYVKISVRDEGTGIPEEHLAKIFDPFFTTKEQGSGLGLATSYSIIQQHEGHISVKSELDAGTTFHIYLPASEKRVSEKKEYQVSQLKGEGRILVMDDEEDIRKLARDILRLAGYEVEEADDGAGAVEYYKEAMESGSPFDVVIVDLTVPGGMGGRELIERLLEVDPAVKAIVSSGYSTDPVMADFSKYGFSGAVKKPFRPDEVRKVVGEVIASDLKTSR